jgi:hypothetical protein
VLPVPGRGLLLVGARDTSTVRRDVTASPVYSEIVPTAPGRYVYRLWSADDACLYVGCCGERSLQRVGTRLSAHQREKPWWPQVARIDVASFEQIADFVAEEVAQISAERPTHNKLLRGGAPRPDRSGWAAWEARHPEKVAAKEHSRPSGSVRAALSRRKPGPGQPSLW